MYEGHGTGMLSESERSSPRFDLPSCALSAERTSLPELGRASVKDLPCIDVIRGFHANKAFRAPGH